MRLVYSAEKIKDAKLFEEDAKANSIMENLVFDDHSPLFLSASSDGNVVALSGVIGEDDNSYGYIFKIVTFMKHPTADEWMPLGQPILNDLGNDSKFVDEARSDISLSGNGERLAVAVVYRASRENIGVYDSAGFVRVYNHSLLSASDEWYHYKTIYDGDAGMGGEHVGLKVSLDDRGHKVTIGEMYFDGRNASGDHNVGKIAVYNVDTGIQIGSSVVGTDTLDYAGSSVAMSRNGECFVYGATGAAGISDTGAAYVYCWDESAVNWVKRDTLYGEAANDSFGFAVAITYGGDFIAVGALDNDVNGVRKDAGHVRVYHYNGVTYSQVGSDIDGENGETAMGGWYYVGDAFGTDIGISDLSPDDCIRIVIGAPENQDMGYYMGQVSLLVFIAGF